MGFSDRDGDDARVRYNVWIRGGYLLTSPLEERGSKRAFGDVTFALLHIRDAWLEGVGHSICSCSAQSVLKINSDNRRETFQFDFNNCGREQLLLLDGRQLSAQRDAFLNKGVISLVEVHQL